MRLKLAVLVLAIACIPSLAHADDAAKMTKIQEFFKVAKLDQLSAQSQKLAMERVKSGIIQRLYGVKLTADQQKQVDALTDKVMEITLNALSWNSLEPEYAKLYADAYTEQQIDDLIAFYKSPTGQVMVQKNPVLMSEANAIANKHMEAVVPQIRQLLQDFAKQQAAEIQKQAEKATESQKSSQPQKSEPKQ